MQSHFSAIPSLQAVNLQTTQGYYNVAIAVLLLLIVFLHSGYTTFLLCQIPASGHASSLPDILVSFYR